MKFFVPPLILIFLFVSGCGNNCPDGDSNISYTPNPFRGVFPGNYHVAYTPYNPYSSGPQNYDLTITVPSNSYGNWISIGGQIYSTYDSNCTLNNNCVTHSSNGTYGFIRNDSIYITTISPDAQPPDFIWSTIVGVKF